MKVFISWSGGRSKAVGELLNDWLKCVLQAIDPWMSSKDIDRGSLWFSQISDQLKNTGTGIICITSSNLNNPWILFEAGALAKGLSSNRVCTFLVDLSPADIGDPLAQFNHTIPTEEGVWSLVKTLNDTLEGSKLSERILENVFATYWPQFELQFKQIIENTKDDVVPIERDEEDMLSEILYATRSLERRMRSIENKSKSSRNMYEANKKIFNQDLPKEIGDLNINSSLYDELNNLNNTLNYNEYIKYLSNLENNNHEITYDKNNKECILRKKI